MSKPDCKVIPFRPRAEFEAHQQLDAFIEHVRNELDLFDTDPGLAFDWAKNTWDTGGKQRKKGFNAAKKNTKNSAATINFTKLGSTRWHSSPMSEQFIDFAKAYIRYDLTFNWQAKADSHLTGLKLLEAALLKTGTDGIADVTQTDATTFDVAAELIRENYKNDARYQAAWRLQKIGEFLTEHQIVDGKIEWENPFTPPAGGRKVTDDELAADKLPDRKVLEALGSIFYTATEPQDILVTSMSCVLSAGPSRTCEVVHCQNKIEVWFDNADGTKDLGLAWYPAKGGEDGAKPIPKDFEPVVLRALEKTREITDEARRIALFYEKQGDNPTKLYLPKKFEHLRKKKWLTNREVFPLYGWTKTKDVAKMMNEWGIRFRMERVQFLGKKKKDGTQCTTNRKMKVYSFDDIESHILGYLPQDFPWLDKANRIKYSEALFVTLKGFTNPMAGNNPCMFEACQYSTLHRKIGLADKNNIFTLHGYSMPDGSPMTLQTHQIRRWLNTLAERGGMSDWERDFWSGRKPGSGESTSRSSRAYVFVSLDDYLKDAGIKEEAIDQTPFQAAIANRPISLEEFKDKEGKPLFHATEYGMCPHSFSLKPCEVHVDCLNCKEHCVIKGDKKKTERIRLVQELNIKQLEVVKEAVEEKYRYADQWFMSTSLNVRRTEALLKILYDPSLPDDGSVIIMLNNPFQYSAFRNAVEHRVKLVGDASTIQLAKALAPPPFPLPGN